MLRYCPFSGEERGGPEAPKCCTVLFGDQDVFMCLKGRGNPGLPKQPVAKPRKGSMRE